jgi:E3 ubiquitin-protein ligase SHPRH
VLGSALKANRIGYSSISDKRGISLFREDASVECFLLHAKADSSGLNLTNATHVFLCEPMINAAIELQAIARVHRIGQMRETTVWMFLVEDTVEEAIYEISVKRRLAHIQGSDTTRTGAGRVEEQALDAANSQELQAAPLAKLMNKGQSEGEIVDKDDLWICYR